MTGLDGGFTLTWVGDEIHGESPVYPDLFVPGTSHVRLSVLATWTDIMGGYLSMEVLNPLIPVTMSLDVHAHRPVPECGSIRSSGRVLSAGRSVATLMVEITSDTGDAIAVATASFMAPDPNRRMPEHLRRDARTPVTIGRDIPFVNVDGCQQIAPGIVSLSSHATGRNTAGSFSGASLASAVEDAALSLCPGTTLSMLSMRYVKPVIDGPAIARAVGNGSICQVEVRDCAKDDRLAISAITRSF